MKTHCAIALLMATFIAGCEEERSFEKACDVEEPVEELSWLAEEIKIIEQSDQAKFLYVSMAEYNHDLVFIFHNCCPFCSYIQPVKNCAGALVGILGKRDEDVEYEQVSHEVIIWKPDNLECAEHR